MRAAVPIEVVSPPGVPAIHRFFDTSPFSPSGRYLGLTRFPEEGRMPQPGAMAGILIVDRETGETTEVDRTRAWDTQLGAHVQWGSSDEELIYNITKPGSQDLCARVKNPWDGSHRDLDGPVYMVNAAGTEALAPNLFTLNTVQAGYGVFWAGPKEWEQCPPPDQDGVWITDLRSGSSRLLLSNQAILEAFPGLQAYGKAHPGRYVCFHVKWNPQSTRIFTVFRFSTPDQSFIRNAIVSANADGSNLHLALHPETWIRGGHHPNWCPDGEHILMNLQRDQPRLELVRFACDGSGLEALSRNCPGSGHPTLHPDGRHILTDAYPHESRSPDTVPLRWIDLQSDSEVTLADVPAIPPFAGPRQELRIDPHPAWDRSHTRVAFNCLHQGTRAVAVADLSKLLAEDR